MNLQRLAVTAAVTSFFAFPLYLVSQNSGAPAGNTGGNFPGESSCGNALCHNVTPNTGPGRVFVTVNGAPLDQYRYTPGETVAMTVRVEDPSPDRVRWGFQLTIRSAAEPCQSAGNLVPGGPNVTVFADQAVPPCVTPQYATHTFAQLKEGGDEFVLNWTAPAENLGALVVAAAGNAGNGNNERTGDRIYQFQTMIQPPPPAPRISAGGVVLATLDPTVRSAAANAILSVFGQEFAPAGTAVLNAELDASGKVATRLANTCVEMNGERSPLFAIFPGQINFQAPHQLRGTAGPVALRVIRDCGLPTESRGNTEMADVAAVAPGFFVFPQFGGAEGRNPIATLHGGGPDVVAPAGLFPDNAQQKFFPAKAGEFVSLFATGLGETNPAFDAGAIPGTTAVLTGAVKVRIGGIELPGGDVLYAGVAPCCAGLYQLVVKIPDSLGAGQHAAVVEVNGVASPAGPFVPVE